MTRALIGEEGGVPPILLVSRGGPWGWGVYLRTRRRRISAGPMFGWQLDGDAGGGGAGVKEPRWQALEAEWDEDRAALEAEGAEQQRHGGQVNTTSHHHRWKVGRLQVGFHLYIASGRLPDRWVVQPFVIYDRKQRNAREGK